MILSRALYSVQNCESGGFNIFECNVMFSMPLRDEDMEKN